MTDIGEQADGRRFVGLYRPIQVAGQVISGVTFKPMTYGHLISWQTGQYSNAHQLLMDLTGLSLAQIYALKRPDDQRIMDAMTAHVHPGIAADMEAGVVPIAGVPGQDGGPVRSGLPPAAGTDPFGSPASEWANAALRASDAAEARTAAHDAEELRLSQIGEDADDLDQGPGAGYSGAFGGDPAT